MAPTAPNKVDLDKADKAGIQKADPSSEKTRAKAREAALKALYDKEAKGGNNENNGKNIKHEPSGNETDKHNDPSSGNGMEGIEQTGVSSQVPQSSSPDSSSEHPSGLNGAPSAETAQGSQPEQQESSHRSPSAPSAETPHGSQPEQQNSDHHFPSSPAWYDEAKSQQPPGVRDIAKPYTKSTEFPGGVELSALPDGSDHTSNTNRMIVGHFPWGNTFQGISRINHQSADLALFEISYASEDEVKNSAKLIISNYDQNLKKRRPEEFVFYGIACEPCKGSFVRAKRPKTIVKLMLKSDIRVNGPKARTYFAFKSHLSDRTAKVIDYYVDHARKEAKLPPVIIKVKNEKAASEPPFWPSQVADTSNVKREFTPTTTGKRELTPTTTGKREFTPTTTGKQEYLHPEDYGKPVITREQLIQLLKLIENGSLATHMDS